MAGPEPGLTDAEAVKVVLDGNLRAFDSLVERYFTMVSMIGYARLRNKESAEDLAQEVFLRAYLNLDHLDPPARFGAWLSRIARNLAIDWLKQNRRSSQLIASVQVEALGDERTAKRPEGVLAQMEKQEQHRLIHEAIGQLSPAQREIVLLHYVEQWSKRQIAERLAIHPGNVGRQLDKALQAMKGSFESLVRASAAGLRPDRRAVARTLALVAGVALLPAPAKAALLTAAAVTGKVSAAGAEGATIVPRTIGWLRAVPAALATGGPAMIIVKGTTVTAVVLAAVVGGSRLVSSRATQAPLAGVAATPSTAVRDASRPLPLEVDEGAPAERNAEVAVKDDRDGQVTVADEPREMPNSAGMMAVARFFGPSAESAHPPAATAPVPKPAPDFDLILEVVKAHRENLEKLRTWQGNARLEQWHYPTDQRQPQTQSDYERIIDVAFALDRTHNALSSRWLESDPDPRFSNILLKDNEFYRYRSLKRGKTLPQLVIFPRSSIRNPSPETGDHSGFDPTWYMEKPLFNDLEKDLLKLHANARDPKEARPWLIPNSAIRKGDLIIVEQTHGRGPWRYTFDLSQGGNLVAYTAGTGLHPLEVKLTYHEHEGVWIVESFQRISIDKPVGDHPGQTQIDSARLFLTSLNRPLSDSKFALSELGVTENDTIEDRRGQIIVVHEVENTEVPAGQELKLTRGQEEWKTFVREKIISAWPPLNDTEEASVLAILDGMLPQAAKYEREHESDFVRLRAECAGLVGLRRPRRSTEAAELVEAVRSLNRRWTELERPISVTFYGRLQNRVEEVVKAAGEQRRPQHDAAIAKITPNMMETMQSTQLRAFDIARSCHIYAAKHKGEFPPDLQELVNTAGLKPDKLRNPRRPGEQCGYTYIRPPGDDELSVSPGLCVLVYEVHDQWPEGGIAVALADGHAEWVNDEIQFNRMLEATLMPGPRRGSSSPERGERQEPRILLPDGRLSRFPSEVVDIEGEWERYVREFIAAHGLDQGQQESAYSILRELSGQAAGYRLTRRQQFEDLDLRLRQLSRAQSNFMVARQSFQRTLLDLREQRQALERPLDAMFDQLKGRLKAILNQAQRREGAKK